MEIFGQTKTCPGARDVVGWRRGKAREGRELAISNSRHPPYATHWIPNRVETFNGEIICATDVDKVKRT